ncbi:hypothetical protein [Chthonobacter albigriseus]|uniref:hypothetical protein n=1 Tax=Chthonobacter albigriseus TaxID=1683161 RepID=UPI0015EF1367|nr:hypothetical protein [Chthonobacter albigriseus]
MKTATVFLLAMIAAVPPASADSATPNYICDGTTTPCPEPYAPNANSRDAVRPGNIRRNLNTNRQNQINQNAQTPCGPKPANQQPGTVRNQPGC